MKAYFLTRFGTAEQAFEIRDTPIPDPGRHQVRIKVEAFGLNFADVLARKGLYPEVPARPCILGYDVVGTVDTQGAEVPVDMTGKRVVALTRFGGYAEYACTDYRATAVLPADYPAELAVALGTQFTTAYVCIYEHMRLVPGRRVLVHAAAGGVGLALCQLALAEGCEVYGTVSSSGKVDFLRKLGVQHAVNYRAAPYAPQVKTLLGSARLDAAFNSLAGRSVAEDMKLLGSGGKLVLYGAASRVGKKAGLLAGLSLLLQTGFMSPLALLMRSKSIVGVNILKLGDYCPETVARCMADVVAMALPMPGDVQGRIRPVCGGRYGAGELTDAHRALEARGTIGKLSVFW